QHQNRAVQRPSIISRRHVNGATSAGNRRHWREHSFPAPCLARGQCRTLARNAEDSSSYSEYRGTNLAIKFEMHFKSCLVLAILITVQCTAQQTSSSNQESAAQTTPSETQAQPDTTHNPNAGSEQVPVSKQQPKRILGIMPNYRAVSAGAIPPPPTPKQAFIIATKNSFDYSSFIFVGLTSMIAEESDAHPQLGKGVAGFGRYYWRG